MWKWLQLAHREGHADVLGKGNDVPPVKFVRRSFSMLLVPAEKLEEDRVDRRVFRNRLTPCHQGVILLLGDLLVRP